MAFAISAYFPLGFYQGSDSGSKPESYPSLNRLYSALVSAAYLTFGFEKVDAEYGLTDEQIHDALNWFEDNPPQEILFLPVLSELEAELLYTGIRVMFKIRRNLKIRFPLQRLTSPPHMSSILNLECC